MTILDIEGAVALVENSINAGKSALFVTTEFGVIAIEVNSKGYIPESTVEVNTWENAVPTRWAMKHRAKRADYHVIICRGKSKYCIHSRIVAALSECMMMDIFKEDICEGAVDAAVKSYMSNIDKHVPNTNYLEREYAENNLGIIARNDIGVCNLVRDLIVRRDAEAERIIQTGQRLSLTTRNCWEPSMTLNFSAGYDRDILYIILYIADVTNRRFDLSINLKHEASYIIQNGVISEMRTISGTCTMTIDHREVINA